MATQINTFSTENNTYFAQVQMQAADILTDDERRQIGLLTQYFRDGLVTAAEAGEWFADIIQGRQVFPAFDPEDLV